jgi:hypothetical protein
MSEFDFLAHLSYRSWRLAPRTEYQLTKVQEAFSAIWHSGPFKDSDYRYPTIVWYLLLQIPYRTVLVTSYISFSFFICSTARIHRMLYYHILPCNFVTPNPT